MPSGVKESEELVKVTVRLYRRDLELAQQFFPTSGYNVILRRTFRSVIRTLERRREAAMTSPTCITREAHEEMAHDLMTNLEDQQ